MLRYIALRIGQAVIVLALSSVIVFALIRSAPGNPAEIMDGTQATPAELAATERALGLRSPLIWQYFVWAGRLARGEFGTSITDHVPVISLIGEALPATLWLLAGAMFVAVVRGLVELGLVAAGTRRRWLDTLLGGIMSVLYGAPAVSVGLIAILVFAVHLHWLPPEGYVSPITHPLDGLKSLLLPSLVLGLGIAGIEARFVRASVGEAMSQEFALAARAKGGRRVRVLLVHGARNGLLPVITTYGLELRIPSRRQRRHRSGVHLAGHRKPVRELHSKRRLSDDRRADNDICGGVCCRKPSG